MDLYAIYVQGAAEPLWGALATARDAEERAVRFAVSYGNVELLSGKDLARRLLAAAGE